MQKLVGKKIIKIFINEDYLKFETDQGNICYHVYGDCCSRSYFYDFFGVENLLNNGPVKSFESINLDNAETEDDYDCIQCYGYKITTENPEFGEVSSVFSFRNSSNGYYGGEMNLCNESDLNEKDLKEITNDWINPNS